MNKDPALSIGLIVKNEAKNIERCLSALSPILKKINSEIVIVDTGSTDNTVEIAKQFTEKIYHFQWDNDFSAARNYGLSKCNPKAQWFMYLDADEVLDENVDSITDFILDESNLKEYKSARLILKNYADLACQVYTESRNLRIVNMTIETNGQRPKFIGRVHEGFPLLEPCKQLSQIVHHYGYIAEEDKNGVNKIQEKHRRNMKVLKSLYESDKEDLRILAHIFYSCESNEKERYLTEWYEAAQKNVKDIYALPVYVPLIQTLNDGGCSNDALFYAEEYLNKYADENLTTLSVVALTVCALSSLNQYQLACDFYENYFELYNLFLEGRLSDSELNTCIVFFGTTETDYLGMKLLDITNLLKLNEESKANQRYKEIDSKKVPQMLLPLYLELGEKFK